MTELKNDVRSLHAFNDVLEENGMECVSVEEYGPSEWPDDATAEAFSWWQTALNHYGGRKQIERNAEIATATRKFRHACYRKNTEPEAYIEAAEELDDLLFIPIGPSPYVVNGQTIRCPRCVAWLDKTDEDGCCPMCGTEAVVEPEQAEPAPKVECPRCFKSFVPEAEAQKPGPIVTDGTLDADDEAAEIESGPRE